MRLFQMPVELQMIMKSIKNCATMNQSLLCILCNIHRCLVNCIYRGPFCEQGLTLMQAWLDNYIYYKPWDEITFPNFNGCTVYVWEWEWKKCMRDNYVKCQLIYEWLWSGSNNGLQPCFRGYKYFYHYVFPRYEALYVVGNNGFRIIHQWDSITSKCNLYYLSFVFDSYNIDGEMQWLLLSFPWCCYW